MQYIIPSIIFITIIYSLIKKTEIYPAFTEGAADGMKIVIGIFPAILAMITAVYMLRASGFFDILSQLISPVTKKIGFPSEVLPLALIRPFSGSGSLGILADILNEYGADTKIGRLASIIMGSTETTFYCICVYFARTNIKKTASAIPCAMIGDIVGLILAILLVNI